MPSVHLDYDNYNEILPIVNEARTHFLSRLYDVRDLYDHWEGGVMAFDFRDEGDAMIFKMKYGGRYRPYG